MILDLKDETFHLIFSYATSVSKIPFISVYNINLISAIMRLFASGSIPHTIPTSLRELFYKPILLLYRDLQYSIGPFIKV